MKTSVLLPHAQRAHRDIRGVYAISPDWPDTDVVYHAVLAALAGGIKLLQLRQKESAKGNAQGSAVERDALARKILAACQQYDACFIINDDLELAINIHADGVHLGRADGALSEARACLHDDQILGASCYADATLAATAVAAGADYVAFGSVFPSPTKPQAPRAALELFSATHALGVPRVAIGGITRETVASVFEAGAQAVAVISDLFVPEMLAAKDYAAIQNRVQAWVTHLPPSYYKENFGEKNHVP